MSVTSFYPVSPDNVPAELTRTKANYKKHAWLAMLGLLAFMLVYVSLLGCFGFISYKGIMAMQTGNANLVIVFVSGLALLLTVFMAKSLFIVRKAGEPGGVEVTAEEQPQLFQFLLTLADEVGAPRPHRVFITPDVNAAVFYDLSLLNLIFASKKNLIIGLGLVNVLTLGELKAVLAHEFGHFAQGSMLVGRWVYIAQQIIGHVVAARDWLDTLVRFISRIDIRIAWVGWILGLIIWSIRSIVDTLFSLVIMAERALSREMEFNADLVAVSVTGSDALINALHKLQAADHAWQTALTIAGSEANQGRVLDDLFITQIATVIEIRRILNDTSYGSTPAVPEDADGAAYRLFDEDSARPPQMWATHPANRDREDNAKSTYIAAEIDKRPAWDIFTNANELRQTISRSFYKNTSDKELQMISPVEAVKNRFNRLSYLPRFRGLYLNRSCVRNFASVDDMLSTVDTSDDAPEAINKLYPESISHELEMARSLDIERETLSALLRGELKPSGGVIRHRGEELGKKDIPEAIEQVIKERKAVATKLMLHDANARKAHLLAAKQIGNGWDAYLLSIIHLLHCAEHMCAKATDEQALLVNTWQVITADGQIGWLEKRRMLRVAKQIQGAMREISDAIVKISLPQPLIDETGVDDWANQCPVFNISDVSNKNWGEWCAAASELINNSVNALSLLQNAALEELIRVEELIAQHLSKGGDIEAAPSAAAYPETYPVLLPGNENVLQRKLDLWNRFQLAHGFMPALTRLIVSVCIVGGTVYGGFVVL